MSKLENVWILAETDSAVSELTTGAAALGEKISILQCDCSESESFLSYIPAIVRLVKEKQPQRVLVSATKNGRLAAAIIAASVGTSVLTETSELKIEDGFVVSTRMAYGGAAFKIEKAAGRTIVACIGSAVFEAGQDQAVDSIIVRPDGTRERLIK
jgi:electron transfer flavoprotein alpha subunit